MKSILFFSTLSLCGAFSSPSIQESTKRLGIIGARVASGSLLRSPIDMAKDGGDYDLKKSDQDFWTQQKELVAEMTQKENKTVKQEQQTKYEQRASALVGDTAFFSLLVFPILWLCFDNPLFSVSYLLGALLGLAYVYGLGKYVATLGGSVDDARSLQGAGVGEARFAFLILLFVFVGKFRSYGLVEIPCISGFFTYQLASLSQGLKEFND
jgi:hypothetical protein